MINRPGGIGGAERPLMDPHIVKLKEELHRWVWLTFGVFSIISLYVFIDSIMMAYAYYYTSAIHIPYMFRGMFLVFAYAQIAGLMYGYMLRIDDENSDLQNETPRPKMD